MFKYVLIILFLLNTFCVPAQKIEKSIYTVNKNDVTFRLYTRANPDTYINVIEGQLTNLNIDPLNPFKFIIHGYTDSGTRDWVMNMKNAYLKKGDFNVIIVDWQKPASEWYNISAENTRDVGIYLAHLLQDLFKTLEVSFNHFHLIGHSLGAHVCGFAGKNIIQNGGQIIGRITGMDPARILFANNEPKDRLANTDAAFVDIIHTDGYSYGLVKAIGHIDFYPNGGIHPQPGCFTYFDLGPSVACSHSRSYEYFTESINSNGFISKQCFNYYYYINGFCHNYPSVIMGENVDTNLRGIYYLNTNFKSPFAKYGKI